MELKTGVYRWLNKVNGKSYVGSASVSLHHRRRCHLSDFSKGRHCNSYFRRAWAKYGAKAFVFQVLERCPPELCLSREQFWINQLRSSERDYGYNLCPNAGNTLGFHHSEESKEAISAARSGKSLSEDHRRNIANGMLGTKQSISTCQKKSEALSNRPKSTEARAAMSVAAKKRANTPEYKALISARRRGSKASEETKARMSASHRGKVMSKETRERMSEAKRLWWANRKQSEELVSSTLFD